MVLVMPAFNWPQPQQNGTKQNRDVEYIGFLRPEQTLKCDLTQ